MAKRSNRVKRLDRGPRIIVILFGFILIYISSFVIKYMTKEKVDIHEVSTGSINANNTYTGIAIRKEEVFYSEYAGNINFFVREGEKASVNSIVYTVDETGRVASMIDSLNTSDNSMSETNQTIIRNTLSSYKTGNSDNRFYELYELKDKLEQVVNDSVNENIISNLSDIIKETGSENMFRYVKAPKTGIVVYYTDGYESLTVDQLNESYFNKENYNKTNLRADNIIVADSPVYKLITDEAWQIAIPLTNEQIAAQGLADKKTVQIRFIKDNITTNANFSIVPTAGGTYGVLSLNKFMVQFASDRFVDVEIITSSSFGLKIPVSSIVEKEFFIIPEEYATNGGNKSTIGFLREHQDKDGKIVTEYCDVDVYALVDGNYYVDKSDFSYGDSIIKTDSNERYTVTSVGVLKGVYTVNKGYAVFRRIEIIEQNQEYAIVQTGVSYGLSAYDHIVLDGTRVEENQIIY
ncbi:MAG: HlyD family efflux transporter periplasmic adaptor subunit [Thermoflexaceae bacterium]|nr:HlyD family efflux transporter periplasmic adaptor subunit [Thermoflexaceae bacterium]